jgi:hypothetical protein
VFLGPEGAIYGFLFAMIAYPEAIVASKSVLLATLNFLI